MVSECFFSREPKVQKTADIVGPVIKKYIKMNQGLVSPMFRDAAIE